MAEPQASSNTALEPEVSNRRGDAFTPLRQRTFRTIWIASLFSNFGQLILGVGAAWEMTRLAPSASMVALVQTAMMLPVMLVAVPAGALADMFDRRKIALTGLGFAVLCATCLCIIAWLGLTAPWLLLAFCTLIGSGVALYSPAWQASIGEQVSASELPAAVALGTISYNVARSFGPALGGLIVLAAGAKAAFAINAGCYVPLFIAFLFWRRPMIAARLPPERIGRAIVSGARYARHSRPIRTVMGRACVFGLCNAAPSALAPLIAKNLLHGNASTYGILLGATGVGAIVGALLVSKLRERLSTEAAVRVCAWVMGLPLIVVGLSPWLWLSCLALLVSGGASIANIAILNVSVQLSAPRWVTARALSLFQSALTGGIALGAWLWGVAAGHWGVDSAMIMAGIALALTPLLGWLFPLPDPLPTAMQRIELEHEPEDALGLTLRSGPVVIELDYVVDPANAREFYGDMLSVQKSRLRNGSFDWSLARDISHPERWTERFVCPTWGDYLRMRTRFTQADLDAHASVSRYHAAAGDGRLRRRLERPFGSVRWQKESPDLRQDSISILPP